MAPRRSVPPRRSGPDRGGARAVPTWLVGSRPVRRMIPAVLALVAACGTAAPPPATATVVTVRDVTYLQDWSLDVHAPPDGAGHPVAVLLHGCCGDRADLTMLSVALAEAGVVVVNADWGGLAAGTHEDAVVRASCAVAAARSLALAHGGEPDRLALVGWSDGFLLAALVVLRRAGCAGTRTGPCPTLVGVAGYYGWPLGAPPAVDARARAWLGAPGHGPAANPYAWLGSAAGVRAHLLVGEDDPLRPEAEQFAAALAEHGGAVRLAVKP
jgi:acetyl esterase/lipase